jgi:biopolymer transport protein ExbD
MKYRRRRSERTAPELDITTFLNLMVILVPFLLISAVFSRVTILELSVPAGGSGGAASGQPEYTIEVVVRKAGLELSNGRQTLAAMPKVDGEYRYDQLTDMLIRLKSDYPEKEDATVLMEPDIDYDTLIQVMDRVRATEIKDIATSDGEPEQAEEEQLLTLFPLISIGDAP